MRPIEPLPLHHSWPLYELRAHLAPVLLDPEIARNDAALAERRPDRRGGSRLPCLAGASRAKLRQVRVIACGAY